MNQILLLIRPVTVIAAFIAVSVWGVIYLLSPFARNNSSYVAASLDKEERLATAGAPRLILVGGSNLALGIDSKLLSDQLGYTIVNMGLHAGLGLDFILNESIIGIRRGDVVILSIEHFLDSGNKKLMAQLADVNPQAISMMNLSWLDRIRLFVSQLQLCISSTFYRLIKKSNDPIYYREAFNEDGNFTTHFNKIKPFSPSGNVKFIDVDYSKGITEINDFITRARSKGAYVYFTYPAFQQSTYKLNKAALKNLSDQYKNNLKCPILGNVESFVFNDKYFFDTVYHLDSIGLEKRTSILIKLLKNENLIIHSHRL